MIKRFWLLGVLGCALGGLAHAAPQIEHWRSTNDTPVYFIAAPEIPMLDIEVTLEAGHSRDADLPGLAMMTLSMLQRGAGGLDADQIAQAFENVGAVYDYEVQLDRAALSLRTLTDAEWRESALDTFVTVLSQPDFPAEQLEQRREQMQVGLKKLAEDPGAIGRQAFYRALYGDHPYASPATGTEASLQAIQREDVMEFYRRHLAHGGAVIAMVGALTRQEAEAIAEQIAQALPQGPAPEDLPIPQAPSEAQKLIIPHPSTQAHVYVGQLGVARGQTQHFPLYLGNFTLGGGGFSSRLMQEVRSNRGLAYSVYSYFFPLRLRGPYQLGLQTQGRQAEEAVELVHEEIRKFVASGPTEEELAHSRRNLTLGFPLRIAGNASMIRYLSMIGYYRLPLDYLDTWTDRIEAVTHEQITEAFQSTLDPDKLITVVVGGQNPS